MEIRRRHLGTVYTKSPAQLIQKALVDNSSKIMFAIVGSFIWLGVLFVGIGVVRFVGANVGDIESWKELTAYQLFSHPYTLPVKIIGIIFVWLYVFHDTIQNR